MITPSFSYFGIGTVLQSAKGKPFDFIKAIYSKQQYI